MVGESFDEIGVCDGMRQLDSPGVEPIVSDTSFCNGVSRIFAQPNALDVSMIVHVPLDYCARDGVHAESVEARREVIASARRSRDVVLIEKRASDLLPR